MGPARRSGLNLFRAGVRPIARRVGGIDSRSGSMTVESECYGPPPSVVLTIVPPTPATVPVVAPTSDMP
jgi:hypothetical protein